MNKVLFNYLFTGYFKTVLKVIMIFYCFGLILNLFEEVEFFKNSDSSILIPISLTALYVPNIVIKLLPFIIFISSMWFLLNLRNTINTESLKLEKDENMVNHIDMMKEVLLFGLKTLSKYDFTKEIKYKDNESIKRLRNFIKNNYN